MNNSHIKTALIICIALSFYTADAQVKTLKSVDKQISEQANNWTPELTAQGIEYWKKQSSKVQATRSLNSRAMDKTMQLSLDGINSQKEIKRLKSSHADLSIHKSIDDGSIYFLKASKLKAIGVDEKQASPKLLAAKSSSFLHENSVLLQIEHPSVTFEYASINYDKKGYPHVKMQQYLEHIPIYGREVITHFKAGHMTAMTGRYLPISKETRYNNLQSITEKSAVDIAEKAIKKDARLASFSDENMKTLGITPYQTDLTWLSTKNGLILSWKVDYLANIHERYLIFIDAETGDILRKQNQVCGMAGLEHDHASCTHHTEKVTSGPLSSDEPDLNGDTRRINVYEEQGTYFMIDATKTMFDDINTQIPQDPRGAIATLDQRNTSDGDLFFVANDSNNWNGYETEVSAHFNAGMAYDYFLNTFNRNSIDGRGSSMFSVVNVPGPDGESMDNASWNGYFISYGNGQEFSPLAAALDVAAHEMSHGVIQNTANLVYEFQPGALNESFADIFGAMVDREDWNMGEDIVPTSLIPSGTLRNLANPNNGGSRGDFYWQPAHMNEYVNLERNQDNGGVHINSGIPNRAFFNFASAVGKVKAEQVYYHALNNYLSQNSQFIDCRLAVIQSSLDLYDQATANAASKAFDDVGILGNGSVPTNSGDRDELPEGQGAEHMLVHDIDGNDGGTLFDFNVSTGAFTQVSGSLTYPKADHPDDGSFAVYVNTDGNIYLSDLTASNPSNTAQALTSSGGWRKAIVSPDGTRIAALQALRNDGTDNQIVVFDVEGQPRTFEFFNPTTSSDITSIDEPEYGDAIEFNHSGEYILYDAYNVVSDIFSTSEISYWDIGLIEVWNNTTNNYADGDIFKVFPSQPTNISIGNPSFANNTNDVITLDYLDSDDGEIFILAADLVNGDVNAVAQTTGFAGYPSYAPGDDFIAFTDFVDNEDEIKTVALNQDQITPAAEPGTYITGGRWPVWYVQGNRSFQQPTADFDANIKVGEGPLTINFYDQSSNNPSSWSWTFEGGNPSSSDQENPIITFANEGDYNVILTVNNPAGSDTEAKSDYIEVTSSVSIEEIGLLELSIFPNPTHDYLNIKGTSRNQQGAVDILLLDQNGKLIQQQLAISGQLTTRFDVSGLPSGVYQVMLRNGLGQHTSKIVVD